MAPDPPESDDPYEEWQKKYAEEQKRTGKPPDFGDNPPENGPDPTGSGEDRPKGASVTPLRRNRKEPDPDLARKFVEPTSEQGLQFAFSAERGSTLQHVEVEGQWYFWNGSRWTRDDLNRVLGYIKNFCWKEALASKFISEGMRLASLHTVLAVERLARMDARHTAGKDQWDRDAFLLGCPTVVVDLRTGEIRSHRRADHILLSTAVDPAPLGTPHPIWSRYLDEATGRDTEYQAFLQRLGGYCLTGSIKEHVLAFVCGEGGTGKGVLLHTLADILGDYHFAVKKEMLTASPFRDNSAEYWRAQMFRKRLITCEEVDRDTVWAEGDIKQLTGGGRVPARHPAGQPFSFVPEAKFVISGNHQPNLADRSRAMERRLRICPFSNFPRSPDPDLEIKLRAEWPAILASFIQGALDWQQHRLGSCPIVTRETQKYFEEQDTFAIWLTECCVLDPVLQTKPAKLLASYNDFLKRDGLSPISLKAFAQLVDRTTGLSRSKSDGIRWVEGIGFKVLKKGSFYDDNETYET